MKKNPCFGTVLLPALLMLLFAACQKESRNEAVEEDSTFVPLKAPGGKVAKDPESNLLKSVRRATARFHSTTQAIKAGYAPDKHCVFVKGLGGMGYHWVNRSLVDGMFDPLKPEAVLYAPGPGGNLRLVAVEYIVAKAGQAPPKFGNQPFDDGGTPLPFPHWSLHVWLYESNPAGMYVPFNPNVRCP